MPEEFYFQTPYPERMNFAEQMMHQFPITVSALFSDLSIPRAPLL